MNKIQIHGKDYVMVKDRIIFFNDNCPNGSIITESKATDNSFIFKSKITPDVENPSRYFTGHAEEIIGSSQINKTSALENCETSAWGRALANLGIGLDTSVASYEEVANAVKQQATPASKPKLDEDKFNNMLKAIEAGKADAVKAKMPSYDIEDYQMKILKSKLNG